MSSVYLGAQPIYLRDRRVFGYELLFQKKTLAPSEGKKSKTVRQGIDNTLTRFGIKHSMQDKKLFIGADADFLNNPESSDVPLEKLIFELTETCLAEKGTVEKIASLHKEGYRFALKGFDLSREHFRYFKGVLPFVSVVRIDLTKVWDVSLIRKRIGKLLSYGIDLMADRVDSIDMFSYCRYLGFHYYQGKLLSRPKPDKTAVIGGKSSIIDTLNLLLQETNKETIDERMKKLPEMHSIANGTFSWAITASGVRDTAIGLLLSLYGSGGATGSTGYFYESARRRSELMYRCAQAAGLSDEDSETAALVGLVSLLENVLHVDLEEIFGIIAFDGSIKEAVMKRKGSVGKLLRAVHIAEQGRGARLLPLAEQAGLDNSMIQGCIGAS